MHPVMDINRQTELIRSSTQVAKTLGYQGRYREARRAAETARTAADGLVKLFLELGPYGRPAGEDVR